MTGRLVVVGAALAGVRAVEAARTAGFGGTVTLVGAEDHLPYDRPPLSKAFLDADGPEPPVPVLRDPAALRDELGVELRLGAPATALDTRERTVSVGGSAVRYDALVIATGSRPLPPTGAGRLGGVHTLRTVEDARAIRRALDSGARTVVVGAGFVGAEVASAARRRGLDVTMVDAASAPLARALGEPMGRLCAEMHADHGTDLRLGVTVTGMEGAERVERVLLSDGSTVPADLVVAGIGARPATEWLDGSDVAVDDGVLCDPTLATSVPGVYAAGDVARWLNPLFGTSMRLEHWTNAAEQGAAAARNAVGADGARPFETVPYFWSDWYGVRIQFVGVPGADDLAVFGDVPGRRFIALYRLADRLAGVLAVGRRPVVARYRALLRRRATWSEALEYADGTGAATGPSP
ncbi:NAD(P)/FAD-dependent oxidoreductase [Thermomonospora umbrina]|uniref:NAD/ferredoxin-dependent reductase-like protein n=1 Tax=Thermomonospora umbrina TaxID=111806 RepID=A0A3D9SYB7_9ACTN|nr:FAD-dependent oxidoreductase [Thermomonospora umbrina]REF00950.1 NAD/ferredoxin-dependent reductase-like protein [Thermomonospora umbrina]